MRRADIPTLFQVDGPFVSVYLATSRNEPNAAQRLALRWKDGRRELAAAGAPEALLDAIAPAVDGAHTRGATLAAVAGRDGLLVAEDLPQPPLADSVCRFGPLPDVVELLRQLPDDDLVWLAVRIDRTGAQVAVLGGDHEARTARAVHEVEGVSGPEIRKSKPGGWSQRRLQERAERLWHANARDVAERLAKLVDDLNPRLVAVAGDVRAVQLLRETAPERVAGLLREVGGELADLEQVVAAGAPAVAELARADLDALLDRFAEERGQGDQAVHGVQATLEALSQARVRTLLVVPERLGEATAWFGPAPLQVGDDPAALRAVGVDQPVQARLVDILARATFAAGGDVRVLSGDDERFPADGVGALVRWREPEAQPAVR